MLTQSRSEGVQPAHLSVLDRWRPPPEVSRTRQAVPLSSDGAPTKSAVSRAIRFAQGCSSSPHLPLRPPPWFCGPLPGSPTHARGPRPHTTTTARPDASAIAQFTQRRDGEIVEVLSGCVGTASGSGVSSVLHPVGYRTPSPRVLRGGQRRADEHGPAGTDGTEADVQRDH